MKVFIANFGQENYEWPVCRERGTVATMNSVSNHGFWVAGDRDGYIANAVKEKTAAGAVPPRSTASRWFNLMSIVSETSGDIWIHRDGERLWWTTSRSDPPTYAPQKEPVGRKRDLIVCHKPCDPWSDISRTGQPLLWRGLHPKARDFLSTEATLQQLSEDYAAYALALVNGDDLERWHSQPHWKAKLEAAASKAGLGTSYDAARIAIFREAAERMAETAIKTVATANGQQVVRTLKNKEFRFNSQAALEEHMMELLKLQDGLCALSGLPLHKDEKTGDKQFFCSLDRIDSNGHYEAENLQIVCRFVNRWKGVDDNAEFARLIKVIRDSRVI